MSLLETEAATKARERLRALAGPLEARSTSISPLCSWLMIQGRRAKGKATQKEARESWQHYRLSHCGSGPGLHAAEPIRVLPTYDVMERLTRTVVPGFVPIPYCACDGAIFYDGLQVYARLIPWPASDL
jgi:hypothetical protein